MILCWGGSALDVLSLLLLKVFCSAGPVCHFFLIHLTSQSVHPLPKSATPEHLYTIRTTTANPLFIPGPILLFGTSVNIVIVILISLNEICSNQVQRQRIYFVFQPRQSQWARAEWEQFSTIKEEGEPWTNFATKKKKIQQSIVIHHSHKTNV